MLDSILISIAYVSFGAFSYKAIKISLLTVLLSFGYNNPIIVATNLFMGASKNIIHQLALSRPRSRVTSNKLVTTSS